MKRTLERELNSMQTCLQTAYQFNDHLFETMLSNLCLSEWGIYDLTYSDSTRLETRTKESSIDTSI